MIIKLAIFSLLCIFLIRVCSAMYTHLALHVKTFSIPGPWSVPFVAGILPIFLFTKDGIFKQTWSFSKKYKNGMFILWYCKTGMVQVSRPQHFEAILKSPKLITKSSDYIYLNDWLGNGLLTSTDDMWRGHRRLFTPAFHFSVLDQFSNIIVDKVKILNDSIRKLVDENPNRYINFFPMSIKFTLDATCMTIMGLDMDVQRKGDNEYVEALHEFTQLTSKRYFSFWLWPDFLYDLTSQGKSYRNSIKTMHNFTSKIINKNIEKRKESKNKNVKTKSTEDISNSNVRTFLDLLIDLSETGDNPLTLEQVREQVDTFMFGAHETTGIAISYILFCLGNTPEAQKKAFEEINEVVGNNYETPTKQQLSQLKYLERVIKESMRLFPSVPFISRRLTHDVEIDGKIIPKGIDVHLMTIQMHWNAEVWEDPAKFDPDRFLPENCTGRHPYAYVPFSAGPRNCIGQKFAMLLMKTALVYILREWNIYSDTAIRDIRFTTEFVLTPPNGILNLRFESRR